jgi:hypothetical protein
MHARTAQLAHLTFGHVDRERIPVGGRGQRSKRLWPAAELAHARSAPELERFIGFIIYL